MGYTPNVLRKHGKRQDSPMAFNTVKVMQRYLFLRLDCMKQQTTTSNTPCNGSFLALLIAGNARPEHPLGSVSQSDLTITITK